MWKFLTILGRGTGLLSLLTEPLLDFTLVYRVVVTKPTRGTLKFGVPLGVSRVGVQMNGRGGVRPQLLASMAAPR